MVWEVGQKIAERADHWIAFPSTDHELQGKMNSWRQMNGFPYALGAIDCTHVRILKPSLHGDEYINRKRFPSFNVQAVCDANACFMNVDCSWPGSVHDSRIYNLSCINPVMENNRVGALLLGDEGYSNSHCLLTPYRNTHSAQELNYNRIHTKERVVIERAFGQLKARFPILKGPIRLKTERIPTIIVACFVLHNVAKYLQGESNNTGLNGQYSNVPPFNWENSVANRANRRILISQQLYNVYISTDY